MDGETTGTVSIEKQSSLLEFNVLQHAIIRFYIFLLLFTPVGCALSQLT